MHQIDPVKFSQTLPTPDDLWTLEDETNTFCSNISDCLYDTARRARRKCTQRNYTTHTNVGECWNYLVEHGDSKQIWQAIGWNGSFDTPPDKVMKPTDLDFCKH